MSAMKWLMAIRVILKLKFVKYLAYGHEIFKNDDHKSKYRKEVNLRRDTVKSKQPDLPIVRGTDGRLAEPSSHLAKYYKEKAEEMKDKNYSVDIRSALLSRQEEIGDNPEFTKVYKKNQPNAVFSEAPQSPDKE
ncbi:MAG: WD repeat-containing protein 70 [Paramarteilia canceri]